MTDAIATADLRAAAAWDRLETQEQEALECHDWLRGYAASLIDTRPGPGWVQYVAGVLAAHTKKTSISCDCGRILPLDSPPAVTVDTWHDYHQAEALAAALATIDDRSS